MDRVSKRTRKEEVERFLDRKCVDPKTLLVFI